MRLTFWDKLELFPPIKCRLLARTATPTGGVRALTSSEIAARARMTVPEVNSLSWMLNWNTVPYDKIRRFTEACGVDLSSRSILRQQCSYLKREPTYKYLKKSPEWENFYKPLILAYVAAGITS